MNDRSVTIVDYGAGNMLSVCRAFRHVGAEVEIVSDPARLAEARRLVVPGVGAFADCKRGLSEVPGMLDALEETVIKGGRPFLGICVGMQLMAERGREHGVHQGLGWIKGEVVPLEPSDPTLKIPHMGWNELEVLRPHPVLAGLPAGAHAYFVHSYRMSCTDADELARIDYGGPVTAVIGRDNLVGTQFHPEKSQDAGLALIANFLTWRP